MPAWINPWREELRSLLSLFPVRRSPALRRSLKDDWLYAADLPLCAEEAALDRFREAAAACGWETAEAEGWIQLRKVNPVPPGEWFPNPPREEAACLAELLRRHPELSLDRRETIQLLKARETGEDAWDRCCRQVHREFARSLLKKETLTEISLKKEDSESC